MNVLSSQAFPMDQFADFSNFTKCLGIIEAAFDLLLGLACIKVYTLGLILFVGTNE